KTMLLKKLWLAFGTMSVLVVLGVALGYQPPGGSGGLGPTPGKPPTELEALRKENELLKINLQVVLEKVRSQEAELRELRGKTGKPRFSTEEGSGSKDLPPGPGAGLPGAGTPGPGSGSGVPLTPSGPTGSSGTPDPVKEAEAALKQLREARDAETKRRAIEALEKALKPLKESPPK